MISVEKNKKRMFCLAFIGLLGLIWTKKVAAAEYEINSFKSEINVNQDYSLTVKEKIETFFLIPKHGIYRTIPYIYSHNGKTIKANLEVRKVTDEDGVGIAYTVTNYNQSKKIKIGDADKTVVGKKEYIIEYDVDQVVLDYGNGPEIYWNVTGGDWEIPIKKTETKVISSFGEITKTECFGCKSSFEKNQANFVADTELTVVVQISKDNQMKSPGVLKRIKNTIKGNWGYLLAVLPTCLMVIIWLKKGRDKKYISDNIYTKPEDEKEIGVSLFDRPHLPLVYSPIKNLSPAEIGTIPNQKVEIQNIISEIIELARLGFLKIEKIKEKKILGIKTINYKLTKLDKSQELSRLQIDLLEGLFGKNNEIRISDLRYQFYKKIPKLKSDIYDELNNKGISDGNWEKIEKKWKRIGLTLNLLAFLSLLTLFVRYTNNFGPIIILVIGIIPTIVLAGKMPRRTAWGYNLYRQIDGLKYFLSKGKWREEIMEKNLFLEEMLPIAVSLGVVNELSKEMEKLGVDPPKYIEGLVGNNLYYDLRGLESSMTNNLSKSSSDSSSWSGGSGFDGGSSGGGFGGGGGGSW